MSRMDESRPLPKFVMSKINVVLKLLYLRKLITQHFNIKVALLTKKLKASENQKWLS